MRPLFRAAPVFVAVVLAANLLATPATASVTGLVSPSLVPQIQAQPASVPRVSAPVDPAPPNDVVRTPGSTGSPTPSGKQGAPVAAADAMAALPTGKIQATVVTVQLADKTAAQTDSAVPMASALAAISSADAYWLAMTNNRVGISVVASTARFRSSALSTQQPGQIADIVSSELGWTQSAQRALVIFIPSSLNNGAAGMTFSSGTIGGRIVIPQISPLTNPVLTHEFGHTLGLDHANSLQCGSGVSDVAPGPYSGFADPSCSIRPYGDSLDIMGISRYYEKPAISSPNWDAFQLGRGDEIVDAGAVSSSRSFTLSPWAGSSAARAVKFTDAVSGEVYYLELRTPVGFDSAVAIGGNRGVKVVQRGGGASTIELPFSTLPFAGNYNTKETWPAGSTFTTHAGTTVTVESLSDSAAVVTIRPYRLPAVGYLDGATLTRSADKLVLNVNGWAYDGANPAPSSPVHVYITPPNGVQDSGHVVTADLPRPDVNQIMQVPGNHGFSSNFEFTVAGTFKVCVYAIGSQENIGLGCRELTVAGTPSPIGYLDSIAVVPQGSGAAIRAEGWTLDPGTPGASIPVHLYVTAPDGTTTGSPFTANAPYPGVNTVMQVPGDHGFKVDLPISQPGNYKVCAYGLAVSLLSDGNTMLGCKTLQVDLAAPPVGYLESVTPVRNGGSSAITAVGWTLDPGTPAASIPVHLYVTAPDGTTTGYPFTANVPRSDVNGVMQVPGDHGFKVSLPLNQPGSYKVCAYGLAVSLLSAGNTMLGCKTFQVMAAAAPIGYLDSVTVASSGTSSVIGALGWTLDPGTPAASIPVHLYVTAPDGTTTGYPFTANVPRSDVNGVMQVPGDHGFKMSLPLKQPGIYKVCAYGLAVSPLSAGDSMLGCKSLQY
ncbi:hypothetical protein [Arthrobacter sp. MMS18-M83]|uniref:hypothetical protein n=1 Tax=Arthrobacter sp. MMS18-M83 TaxID=2996261 RepID=UPI00227B9D5D|nr:hypothetical protein [Arthrobacter sp. MMS18-M83]WAH96686.1 hypothetical protein OW521_20240 [Arthrobacter sp. MMS18-M83]